MPCRAISRCLCSSVLALMAAMTNVTEAEDDNWHKLRERGAEVYYVDADIHATAKERPTSLSAVRKKLKATDSSLDWTYILGRGRIHDQSGLCCWAYATVAAMEYNWALRNWPGSVPEFAVQPVLDRVQKNGGGVIPWATQDLLEHGTCDAAIYPNVGKPGQLKPGIPMPYRLIAWSGVWEAGGVAPVDRIKQALVEHGPVVTCITATEGFRDYKGGVYSESREPQPTTHMVVIVGWNDRLGKEGCWRVQNSWGPKWGENGFMWIEYGSNRVGASAGWLRVQDVRYALPAEIHKQVTAATEPFPTWPKAKSVKLPRGAARKAIGPVEALTKLGQRVVVEMTVRGGIPHAKNHADLYSTPSWRDEECLVIRILASELGRFASANPKTVIDSYVGKKIRVRGSVQENYINVGNRPIIEVADPDQIELVE